MDFLSDILIVFIGLLSAVIFLYLGTERLYRFYFGIILGFLLFLVFNLQVKVIQLSGGVMLSGWDHFLVGNRDSFLGFFVVMIPIFGLLFAFLDSDLKSNKLFSGLFGFLLPIFGLGIFAYILLHSSIELAFLKDLLMFFDTSKIFEILQKAPKLIFSLLLIIIFWKYIFAIILSFLGYLAKLISAEIKELRGEKEEEQKEESKRIKLH